MFKREAPEYLMRRALAWCPALELFKEDAIIAGGFVRAHYAKEKPADLDIYFRTEEALDNAINILNDENYTFVMRTENAITFKNPDNDRKIQLIGLVFGEPEAIINSFDFTVCSACCVITSCSYAPPQNSAITAEMWETYVYTPSSERKHLPKHILELCNEEELVELWSGEVYLHDDFFEHLAARILVFTGSEFPLASLARAFKYQKKGYTICDGNIIAISEAIAKQVNFNDPEQVTTHVRGLYINRID